MDAYATSAELLTYTGLAAAPADADRLLARASDLLDAVVTAAYEVDLNGIPTNADVKAALSKACCAVVEQWVREAGEGNDIDGLAGSALMLTGTTGYQGKRPPRLAPRARDILIGAGLVGAST